MTGKRPDLGRLSPEQKDALIRDLWRQVAAAQSEVRLLKRRLGMAEQQAERSAERPARPPARGRAAAAGRAAGGALRQARPRAQAVAIAGRDGAWRRSC